MNLDNSYARLPEGFHALVETDAAAAPSMLAWNIDLAVELGLDSLAEDEAELARIFSGASRPVGVQPIALAYAGHQFGHFVPQLGDGRAALMNSVNPVFIPRNHRIEQAIQEAVAGDLTVFRDLNVVLAQPFLEQPEYAKYAAAPEPNERVTQTFCGT